VPFHDPHGRKGVWEPFTRAPRHRVVRYALLLDGVGARPWTVALLADLHVGAHAGDVARYRAIVAETNALRPDLVLLLGDYMNTMPGFGGWVAPETVAAILEPLRAPHGVYAVLGNHDWRYGPEVVRAALRSAGIAMIDNEIVPVARGSDRLTLVGLDDEVYGRPDLSLLDGAAAPRLLVTHNPGLFLDLPEGWLMVAGHMHGGQIRVPGLPALAVPAGRAPRRWASGCFAEGGGRLVVSAGLGVSGLPWRWGIAPEIVLLTLSRPEPGG
jgi:predicted MPP superfamily phosphohydrolase